MTTKDAEKQIADLSAKLSYWNDEYYQNHNSVVSDFEFDKALEKLQQLEKDFPALKKDDSPTARVGGSISKDFASIPHKYPMLSLGNTYSQEELEAFDKRVKTFLGNDADVEYICELKFDGVSMSITYENGKLVQAVTRGDGVQGDDVTANVKTIKTMPLSLKGNGFPAKFEVRGEVFMSHKTFERLNAEKAKNGEPLSANPRNLASGSVKQQDSREVAKRGLDCFLYFLLGEKLPYKTHEESIKALTEWGFNVSPTYKKCKNMAEVLEYVAKWDTDRKKLPMDTDGVVIKVNEFAKQEELGLTAKSPRWAIAYKYQAESTPTLLQSITYQVGRTGAITPVAELKPVLLSGSTVKRASLHNSDFIEKLDLRVGDTVYVEKGGEIIPKVTGVDLSKRPLISSPLVYPTHCPECNTKLVRNAGEANYYCLNENGCAPQIKGKMEHFVERKAMDIDSLGEKIIEQLYNAKIATTFADFYDLTHAQLTSLDRSGDKLATKILKGIEESKKMDFDKVLYALGIRFVGSGGAKKLADALLSIDKMMTCTVADFTAVPEIGDKIAQSLVDYFKDPESIKTIDRLKKAGVNLSQQPKNVILASNKLSGKSFLVSGTFSKFSRDELHASIEANGGKLTSGISAKLDYLIAGDKMGPAKLEKATKLKVTMISEDEYIKLIG